MRTGFVTACAVTTLGLSTDFLLASSAPAFLNGWAAARPGFSTDLLSAGLAAFAGLSVDVAIAWGNVAIGRAGTSRVSVFRLAWSSKEFGSDATAAAPASSVAGCAIGAFSGAGAEAR